MSDAELKTYATVEDAEMLWRPMNDEEKSRAKSLIPIICADLRAYATKVGKNLDEMIEGDANLKLIAKSVVVDVLGRTLMTSTDSEPMTQTSESALGYSISGTYLVPGGGLFIKRSEYARLGLRKQRIGVINLWD